MSARVTVVLTQRDRMSRMQESLASLLENTDEPIELLVVTGAAPAGMRAWIANEARARQFRHIDAGRPLTPAEARNIGVAQAQTEYVAFVENDILYTKGWLTTLIACAEETGAALVAPLTCEGRPAHTIVHHIGPVETNRPTFVGQMSGDFDYDEEFFQQGRTISEIKPLLIRRRTQYVEMHCFLARREVFDRIGVFDPDIVSKEYLDFCWRAHAAGQSIWLEPASVVTFLVPSETDPVSIADLPYFLLRWSRAWQRRSHDALKRKWGLKEDGYVASRRALADWRIVDHVLRPALESVPVLGRRWGFVRRTSAVVAPLLAGASAVLAWRYDILRRASAPRAA